MNQPSPTPTRRRWPWRAGALIVVAVIAIVAWWLLRDRTNLAGMVESEARLRDFYRQHAALTYALAFLIYLAVSALSLPGGGTALTFFYGWFFGFWRALVIVSFGATGGALIAFWLSRYLLRDWVERRFGERLKKIQEAFARDGAWYLLSMRATPLIPYALINIWMGVTPIRTRTYWWASQLGMLPATSLYTYIASSIPSLEELSEPGPSGLVSPRLMVGLVLLAVFPLLGRWLAKRCGW